MKSDINISIIIPLYNKAQSITQTIDCVLNQTYQDFEIVIVNDGSTDDSVAVACKYNDTRIRLINKENGGVSSARNRGIKEAKYQYIALLDADDYWEPNYLEEQVKMINSYPEAYMWGMGWGYLEDNKKTSIIHFARDRNFIGYIDNFWTKPKKSNIFWTTAVVINKDIFDKIEMFDERISYGEDLDVWWRIILNFKVAFNSNILAYYRQDAENRAMLKMKPLEKQLSFYIEKYSNYRALNKDFRFFFDSMIIGPIYESKLAGTNKEDVKRILQQINLREHKFSMRFRMFFPKTFNLICKMLKYK